MNGEIIEELKKWVQLQIDDSYRMSEREVYADIVREKITSEERIDILRRLGEQDFKANTFYSFGYKACARGENWRSGIL